MSPLDTFMFDWFGDTLAWCCCSTWCWSARRRSRPGRAWPSTWRPWRQLVLYTALLSAGLRFFDYALADGELWSIGGFLLGWLVQFAIAGFAYRLTRARQMVRQYPWLYQRKGLLGWEERH